MWTAMWGTRPQVVQVHCTEVFIALFMVEMLACNFETKLHI